MSNKSRFLQDRVEKYLDEMDADFIQTAINEYDAQPFVEAYRSKDAGEVNRLFRDAVHRYALACAESDWTVEGADYSAQRQEDHEWAQHFKMPPEFRP